MKQALVFADRLGEELVPLNEHYAPAMLPVAGHPVLEYTLDRLQSAGVEEVFLVVPAGDTQIRNYFEGGVRWSLTIHYLSARADDTPDRVRLRLGNALEAPFAALRGDVWRCPSSIKLDDSAPFCGLSERARNQYELWCNTSNSLQALAWQKPTGQASLSESPRGRIYGLVSLVDYHQLATASADPAWWPVAHRRAGSGLYSGALSRVHPASYRNGHSCIGDFSLIELGAELSGLNAVGHHCFVARGAALNNAVVLDNTFVGAGMRVENAIVIQQRIIRVDLNATLDIQDAFFLAPSRTKRTTELLYRSFERLLAVILLGLSLTASLMRGADQNYLTRFEVRRALRQTLAGRLALFGRPQSSRISDQLNHEDCPWLTQFQSISVGALSPAALAYPGAKDPVLLSLAEIELYAPLSLRALLKQGLRAIIAGLHPALKRSQPAEPIALTEDVRL